MDASRIASGPAGCHCEVGAIVNAPWPRLSNPTLACLPSTIARPAYDRGDLTTGIVHLGIGAFHRAHQAIMTETAIADGDPHWGILGASLRAPDTRDALRPQDWLYTAASRDGNGERLQVVGALTGVLVAAKHHLHWLWPWPTLGSKSYH